MKKNIFKTIRLATFIAFILYMLETIFIAGMFTNFILLDCQHFLIHFLFGHICKSILNWSHIV